MTALPALSTAATTTADHGDAEGRPFFSCVWLLLLHGVVLRQDVVATFILVQLCCVASIGEVVASYYV